MKMKVRGNNVESPKKKAALVLKYGCGFQLAFREKAMYATGGSRSQSTTTPPDHVASSMHLLLFRHTAIYTICPTGHILLACMLLVSYGIIQ
jgi:hypothetical protein